MQLPEIDFSNLEIREIGSWPLIMRIGVIVLTVVTSIILVYMLVISKELDDLAAAEKNVADKMKDYKDQYNQAVNLDAYNKQMQDAQTTFQEYVNELPAASNIPELIDSLTKIGQKNNLKINSIKIGDPKLESGFYMSLPLTLSMTGQYHDIGLFVSDVSKLARIVTLGDFNIKPVGAANPGELDIDIQAQTYWLASQSELSQQKPEDQKNNKNMPEPPQGPPGAAHGSIRPVQGGSPGAEHGGVPPIQAVPPGSEPPGHGPMPPENKASVEAVMHTACITQNKTVIHHA